jgi:hypothetical protein
MWREHRTDFDKCGRPLAVSCTDGRCAVNCTDAKCQACGNLRKNWYAIRLNLVPASSVTIIEAFLQISPSAISTKTGTHTTEGATWLLRSHCRHHNITAPPFSCGASCPTHFCIIFCSLSSRSDHSDVGGDYTVTSALGWLTLWVAKERRNKGKTRVFGLSPPFWGLLYVTSIQSVLCLFSYISKQAHFTWPKGYLSLYLWLLHFVIDTSTFHCLYVSPEASSDQAVTAYVCHRGWTSRSCEKPRPPPCFILVFLVHSFLLYSNLNSKHFNTPCPASGRFEVCHPGSWGSIPDRSMRGVFKQSGSGDRFTSDIFVSTCQRYTQCVY